MVAIVTCFVEGDMKKGTLERKIVSSIVVWKPVRVVLTADAMCFSNIPTPGIDTSVVLDSIPTHEIVGIVHNGFEADEHGYFEFCIMTKDGGFNSGRQYVHRTKSLDEGKEWCERLEELSALARKQQVEREFIEMYGDSSFRIFRARTLRAYEGTTSQMIVAFIITSSFLAVQDVLEAQYLPADGSPGANAFFYADYAFTILFAIELCINLFSRSSDWFSPFFRDRWNIFDTFVVFVGIFTKAVETVPQLKLLRLVRIFRVVRLFRRVKSLNRIMKALASSLVPVGNSFFLLLLITCIWATLGTHVFSDRSPVFFGRFIDSLFTVSSPSMFSHLPSLPPLFMHLSPSLFSFLPPPLPSPPRPLC
eukprot:557711-Hanusia_phi.AAC.3